MNLNSLSQEEKQTLIEGYYCYPIKDHQNIDKTLEALVNWHETSDYDLERGFDYWVKNKGVSCRENGYDGEFRNRYFDE